MTGGVGHAPRLPARLPARLWRGCARGAVLAFALVAGGLSPDVAMAEITGAAYGAPTTAYGHGVVPGGEYQGIEFTLDGTRKIGNAVLGGVYEDTSPRLIDVTGDGKPEVITVVSYFDKGSALRIWGERAAPDHPKGSEMVVLAETAPIGKRHRWLAVIGAADLDGDGHIEIAYIDRPHLAKTLRIWRLEQTARGGRLVEVASKTGLTNHRIGQDFITGGIRECGAGPEIITVDAGWQNVMATRFEAGQIKSRRLGPFSGRGAVHAALSCQG